MIGAHVAHHSTLRLLRTGNRLRDPPKPSKLVPAAGTESATDAFGRSSAALSSTPAPAPAPAATHLQCSAPATPAAAARGAHHRAAARPLRPQRASSELTSRAAPAIPPARDDDYWSNLGDVLLALRRVRVVVIAGAPSSRPAMGEPCRDAPRRARTREAVLLPWERASKDVRHTLLRNNHRASPSPYPMPPQGFHPLRSLSSLTKTQYIPNETLQSAPGAARQASPRPATKARRAPRRPPLPGECSAGAQRRSLRAPRPLRRAGSGAYLLRGRKLCRCALTGAHLMRQVGRRPVPAVQPFPRCRVAASGSNGGTQRVRCERV